MFKFDRRKVRHRRFRPANDTDIGSLRLTRPVQADTLRFGTAKRFRSKAHRSTTPGHYSRKRRVHLLSVRVVQILSHGCWDPGISNADVNRGNRYFANVNNAETYSKNWSWAFSGHNFDAKQSPTLLSYKIPVVNKDGSLNPIGTVVVNAGAAFDLVVKYYPNEGMAIHGEHC